MTGKELEISQFLAGKKFWAWEDMWAVDLMNSIFKNGN